MSCIRQLSSVATKATTPKTAVLKASSNFTRPSQNAPRVRFPNSSRALSVMIQRNPTLKPTTTESIRHTSNQNPNPHPSTLLSRSLSHSTTSLSLPPKPKPNPSLHGDESIPAFNIWAQIRASRPAVRYTIYTGFALAATAETTFWANVIYAKWFAGEEDKERAEAFLERFREAIKGYRARWMVNYGNYWGANLWGL